MSRSRLVLLLVAALVVGGLVVGLTMGARALAPARSALHYPWGLLVAEAETMNECVECHEPEEFHGCGTCHDDHGSAEMEAVPFDDLILLTGDVLEPGYIAVNEILPYRDQPGTHVALLDFLADHGVEDFESVTLASRDGGFVTFDRASLTPEALLLPHVDGMRFAAENLHVSTWLKGVWRVVVVGVDGPLMLDGQATSMGRLLLGPTRSLTIEQTDVMLRSEADGQIRKGKTASRIEGVALGDILSGSEYDQIAVRDADGQETVLQATEVDGALLALLRDRPEIVLVLPQRSRAHWVTGVAEIERVR
ncbi:MAG TPA: hypothetical protein VM537_02605 [Anaerolineae bacterium]|nr:hypothetical protein [Anaerolineae bacterium]